METSQKKILICDDHPVCCFGLKASLQNIPTFRSQSFYFAHSGAQAMKLVKEHVFHWIFMDLKLPDISGFEVMRNIASSVKGKKIVIFTNCRDFPSLLKLQQISCELPIAAILQKSYALEHLAQVFMYLEKGYDLPYMDSETRGLLDVLSEFSLTKREFEIVELIVAGLTSKEIAQRLNCSSETIKSHRANILEKAHVKNVAELSAWYSERYREASGD